MNTALLKNTVWWGFILWFIGYVLGIIFFMIVPASLIGWFITPIGIATTLWVLSKKSRAMTWRDFFVTGVLWVSIAIIFDYLFIVVLLNPVDGYYKFDVYLYYTSTVILPLLYKWKKHSR